jgi:L-malate glycosyltransferase
MHLLILPSYYPDEFFPNLGSFFKEQVNTLAKFGVQVNVIYVERKSLRVLSFSKFLKCYFQSTVTDEYKWKEYRIKGWNIPGRIGKILWIHWSIKVFERYINENGKPDIIHAHNIFWAGVLANKINKKFKVPFIITEHDSTFLIKGLSQRQKNIAREIYPSATAIIAVSNSLRTAILKIVPELNIHIIPNIVDTDFFKPNGIEKYNDNNVKFLTIGNLNKNKGHELLIDAFYRVLKINENATLDICGDGEEKKKLYEKIEFLKLRNKVKLLGHLSKSQILEKLQESDCLVHSSYFETFGVVLIEAMSCGIAFISTKSGGPEDIYEEKAGYLVETGDVEALSQAMIKFIQQKNTFSKSELRSIAINKYGRKVIFDKLTNIYSKTISNSQ